MIDKFRSLMNEMAAASRLSNGRQTNFSSLELQNYFKDVIGRSGAKCHDLNSAIIMQIAIDRDVSIEKLIDVATNYWDAAGYVDVEPTRGQRPSLVPQAMQHEERERARGRGRGRFSTFVRRAPYPPRGIFHCHLCGQTGHRANHCPNVPGYVALPPPLPPTGRGYYSQGYRGRGGFRGRATTTRGRGFGRGRGRAQTGQADVTQTSTNSTPAVFPFGPRYQQPYRQAYAYPVWINQMDTYDDDEYYNEYESMDYGEADEEYYGEDQTGEEQPEVQEGSSEDLRDFQ